MSEATLSTQAGTGVRRRMMRSAGIVLAILLCGTAGLYGVEWAKVVVVDKPPAPLSKALKALPTMLGSYKALGADRTLPAEQVTALGTEEYLLRDYENTGSGVDPTGKTVSLNLNYYAKGSATPHVPDVCWAGSGKVRYGTGEDFFVVDGVKHKDGTVSDIRMRILSFGFTASGPTEMPMVGQVSADRLLNVAYVFQISGGRYAATPAEVMRHYWDPQAKYAYHTKIEVTVPVACSPAQAKEAIKDFMRASLSSIEECLPDPVALNAEAVGGAVKVPGPGVVKP